MSLKDYKQRKEKKRQSRTAPVIAAVAVVALIAIALFAYTRTPTSNDVYCGVLKYAVFPAESVGKGGSTTNASLTMTTMITYTTSTSILGKVGRTYSNETTFNSTSSLAFGVETICKYISSTSLSTTSSTSSTSA